MFGIHNFFPVQYHFSVVVLRQASFSKPTKHEIFWRDSATYFCEFYHNSTNIKISFAGQKHVLSKLKQSIQKIEEFEGNISYLYAVLGK